MHTECSWYLGFFFWLLMSYSKLPGSDSSSSCPCVGLTGALQTWSMPPLWHSVAALPILPVLCRAAGVAPVTQLSTKQTVQPSALLAAVQPSAAGIGSECHRAAEQWSRTP